jgi:hypothetical protein
MSRIVKATMIATVMNLAVEERRIGFDSTCMAHSRASKTQRQPVRDRVALHGQHRSIVPHAAQKK